MKDFVVQQDCDHIINHEVSLINSRELYGIFPLQGKEVIVRYGLYKLDPSLYYLDYSGSKSSGYYFRVVFRSKRRLERLAWRYFLQYETVKYLCPKCKNSQRVSELRMLGSGNYREITFPENYVQQLYFNVFQPKGEHPFYPYLGSYLKEFLETKKYDTIETAVYDAVDNYNRYRAAYSSLVDEEYLVVQITGISIFSSDEQTLQLLIETNLQDAPLNIGVNL